MATEPGTLKKNTSQASLHKSPNTKIGHIYNEQVSRIQITSDWKDKSIKQEKWESDKLEKFIEEEKMRSHFVANEINKK